MKNILLIMLCCVTILGCSDDDPADVITPEFDTAKHESRSFVILNTDNVHSFYYDYHICIKPGMLSDTITIDNDSINVPCLWDDGIMFTIRKSFVNLPYDSIYTISVSR